MHNWYIPYLIFATGTAQIGVGLAVGAADRMIDSCANAIV